MDISGSTERRIQNDHLHTQPFSPKLASPPLFRHKELLKSIERAQVLDRPALTNILNHVHFRDGFVRLLLRHPQFRETIVLPAFPAPCMGNTVTCTWADATLSGLDLPKLEFLYIVIDNGLPMILAPGTLKEITEEHAVVDLPEKSYVLTERRTRRHGCEGISTELFQNGFHARGELLDFSPLGFRMKLTADPACSFRWLNLEETAMVQIQSNGRVLFSGSCRFVRQGSGFVEREIVFSPADEEIRRYKKKPCRNVRQRMNPPPRMVFTHPILGIRGDLEIHDISTSGFSIYEEGEERLLMPGMIIPEATINFSGFLKLACSVQVIHCKPAGGNTYRCGLAILDMDVHAYSSLTHILTNALDPCANVSSDVNMDALWEFFFETGFLYPKKYRVIQPQRAKFKDTYRKLYQDDPEVARHFTYQKNGKIYGHISMVRAYERAWMIHHHAARAMQNRRRGFMVLKLIMHYLNDMHRLPSANMDYTLCYFRPDNKFPDRVFGGFARELNHSRGCSLDLFAYLPYTRLSISPKLPEGWTLKPATDLDLLEYERVYKDQSDGLLLDALGLLPPVSGHKAIEEVYSGLGLIRKCSVFALSNNGELAAILLSNHSDLGFNLSELLNGVKVLVAKAEALPWSVLSVAISQLAGEHHLDRVPVLFHPLSYVQHKEVPHEKLYQLWILSVQWGNEFMEYIQKRFHMSYK